MLEEPVAATLSRLSLTPIWVFICRDLMPAEAKSYVERARTNALRGAVALVRAELRPSEGSGEERRCKDIDDMIDRFERKIALVMTSRSNRAGAARNPPGSQEFRPAHMAEQLVPA